MEAARQDIRPEAVLRHAVGIALRHPHALVVPLVILGMVHGLLGGEFGYGLERALRYGPQRQALLEPLFEGVEALLDIISVVIAFVGVLLVLAASRAAFMPLRHEGPPRFGLSLRAVVTVYWRGVFALLPAAFIVTLGFYAFLIPGVLALGVFIAVPAVVVAEGLAFIGALARGWELARGHVLEVALVALAPVGIAVVPTLVLGFIPVLGGILAGAAQGAALALVAVLSTSWYAIRLGYVDAASMEGATASAASATAPSAAAAGATAPPEGEAPAAPESTSRMFRG